MKHHVLVVCVFVFLCFCVSWQDILHEHNLFLSRRSMFNPLMEQNLLFNCRQEILIRQ